MTVRKVCCTAAALSLLFAAGERAFAQCPSDLNGDSRTDGTDLAVIVAQWGECNGGSDCGGDLNHDSAVDGTDLSLLLARWGPCARERSSIPLLRIPVTLDSGIRNGERSGVEPIYADFASAPGAEWIRVMFDPTVTDLQGPMSGDGAATVRITSLRDGLHQTLNARSLLEWGFTTAYFNGDSVRIEIYAAAGGSGRVAVRELHAGFALEGGIASICGPTDDRCQSSDPRVARVMPVGCTAWLFDNRQSAMLSAGHCAVRFDYGAPEVVQFNVPRSNHDGTPQHPSPASQYAIDPTSVDFRAAGLGNDWAHFGVFSNSNTGYTPFVAQGMRSFARAEASMQSELIRITGFGTDDGWENETNQTHVGALLDAGPGPVIRYSADTMGGNSGSPVIRESDGTAIGIHTNGTCTPAGGSNSGLTFANPELLAAIANPRGAAATRPASDLDGDGQVDGVDLAYLLGGWGMSCSQGPCADLNGDGIVDGIDLGIQLAAWPPSHNPPHVPSWATLIQAEPDPAIVQDNGLRESIRLTGLAWRVRDTATQIEFVLIPPGTFLMGCSPSLQYSCGSNESPVHQVTLTCAFYLGRYEVTQAQWQARMGSNPSWFTNASTQVPTSQIPNRPVESVSWNMIQGFLGATGTRLPTEAEWEYAYRAGTNTAFHSMPGYPNGTNDDSLVGNIAWWGAFVGGNSGSQTRPVGGKASNGFGLHDMAGNVMEWLQDRMGPFSRAAQTNPTGPGDGETRVARGGSYIGYTNYDRASYRNGGTLDISSNAVGFRVARDP